MGPDPENVRDVERERAQGHGGREEGADVVCPLAEQRKFAHGGKRSGLVIIHIQ